MTKAIEEIPITYTTILKWGSLGILVASTLVSSVWFIAGLKSEIASIHKDIEVHQKQIIEVDSSSLRRHNDQEREIAVLSLKTDTQEKTIQDMSRKLDVAVAILDRIERKITNQPGN